MKNQSVKDYINCVIKNRKPITITTILIVIIFVLLCVLSWSYSKSSKYIEDQNNLISSLNSDLVATVNELGQETVKRVSLQQTTTKLLLTVDSKDSTIRYLQSVIKQQEKEKREISSVVVALTKTVVNYQDSINNVVSGSDTVDNIIYPTYTREIDMFENWISGSVTIGIRDFNIDLDVRNKYSVSTYYERQGLFKPKIPFVEIQNENPYTSVDDVRNFQISPPECNKLKWTAGGGIAGALIMFLILK